MQLLLLVLLFPHDALPNAAVGRVIAIADGDTLTILVDHQPRRIRLAGIDAPEKGQPHGQDAKAALSDMAFNRWAVVLWHDTDRYGRILGEVWAGGHWANLDMVDQGWAWHFKRYSDSEALAGAESDARTARRGLWAGEPMPPWEWRRR